VQANRKGEHHSIAAATFMGWRIPTKRPRRISVPRNAISKQKSAPPWHHHESTAPSTLTPCGSSPSPPVFPAQLLLTASGGFHSTSAADFLNWPNRVWSIGPSLAQTIFDGGSRRAKVRQSQAAYDVTVADYRQTVLTAFQQVKNNLAAVRILNCPPELREFRNKLHETKSPVRFPDA
jgi:hypothetical protein